MVDTGTTLLPLKLNRLELLTRDDNGIYKLDVRVVIKPGQEVAVPVFTQVPQLQL